jgi:hypothetical protein
MATIQIMLSRYNSADILIGMQNGLPGQGTQRPDRLYSPHTSYPMGGGGILPRVHLTAREAEQTIL